MQRDDHMPDLFYQRGKNLLDEAKAQSFSLSSQCCLNIRVCQSNEVCNIRHFQKHLISHRERLLKSLKPIFSSAVYSII